MTRKSWVYVDGVAIPKEDYKPDYNPAAMIMPDIAPFKSPVTNEMINGRAQKREHMRRHDLVEVGNEKVTPRPIQPVPGLREEIERNYSNLSH